MVGNSDALDFNRHSWMRRTGIEAIFETLRRGGGDVRFVGGAVRDALLGRSVTDIDLASTLPPEIAMALLESAGITVFPIGLAHGTITAVIDREGFEITTLRRDKETDGRHAKVEYTDDWSADAARRDFTMNALYADYDGKLFDYFDGRKDLNAGYVRFIGAPADRIKEDVLRILRFFRFFAWFGLGEADRDALKACTDLSELLPHLSVERVWRELFKWLGAVDPSASWRLAIEATVLPRILPEADNVGRLIHLIDAEQKFGCRATPLARLASLLPEKEDIAARVGRKLKMSNRDKEKLATLVILPSSLKGKLDPLPFRQALYEHGADICRDAALLRAAEDFTADLEPALATAAEWLRPLFPLTGDDLMRYGLQPGPRLGEVLKAVEQWWIERDFRPTHEECEKEANRTLSAS